MLAGKLDRLVTLRRATLTRGADGQSVSGFTTVAEVYAELVPGAGSEAFVAEQRSALRVSVFKIRWRADVAANMQLAYRGEEFDIKDVQEVGRRDGLLLTCWARESVSGGA